LKVSYTKLILIEKERVADLDGLTWSLVCGYATIKLIGAPAWITSSGNEVSISPKKET
jgi:hypothetical protein